MAAKLSERKRAAPTGLDNSHEATDGAAALQVRAEAAEVFAIRVSWRSSEMMGASSNQLGPSAGCCNRRRPRRTSSTMGRLRRQMKPKTMLSKFDTRSIYPDSQLQFPDISK